MAVLPIVFDPDPILLKKAQPVRKVNANIRQLLDDMAETMYAAPGVGLAAPQVGIGKRVIVVDPGPKLGSHLYQVVNPEITRHGSETIVASEGCLSIPNWMGDVERWTEVEVRGLDRHGNPVFIQADGWLARIFQHEIDHLDGILYTSKCRNLRESQPAQAAEGAEGGAPAEVTAVAEGTPE